MATSLMTASCGDTNHTNESSEDTAIKEEDSLSNVKAFHVSRTIDAWLLCFALRVLRHVNLLCV